MGVRKAVTERLDRARSFADKVRNIYQEAYDKAVETGKDGVDELVRVGESLEPKIRAVIDDGLHGAQSALDNINKTLADKAIPAFRRGAVSKEQMDEKSRRVSKPKAPNESAPAKKKPVVKKATTTKAPPAKKPVVKKSAAKKPVAKKTATQKPAPKATAAKKPRTTKPRTTKPRTTKASASK